MRKPWLYDAAADTLFVDVWFGVLCVLLVATVGVGLIELGFRAG